MENLHSVGLIGVGGIGTALITSIIQENGKMGVDRINIYHREINEEKIKAIEMQHAPSAREKNIELYLTPSLEEIGSNSDVVVVTIGDSKKESEIGKREDLTGFYFKDIVEIMEGLGDGNFKLLMATNPITPNCLASHIYSKQNNPFIIGFTRSDFERANYILSTWIEEDKLEHLFSGKNKKIKTNVLGPHGYGLIVTNIKIGNRVIYTNEQLRNLGFKEDRTLEKLSFETAQYGEDVKRKLNDYSTPDFFAGKIVESLKAMFKGDNAKDTAAIRVYLPDICESKLKDKIVGPTYSSFPIEYERGMVKIDPKLDFSKIPDNYKKNLLRTMMKEEMMIKKFTDTNPTYFKKLRNHFGLN